MERWSVRWRWVWRAAEWDRERDRAAQLDDAKAAAEQRARFRKLRLESIESKLGDAELLATRARTLVNWPLVEREAAVEGAPAVLKPTTESKLVAGARILVIAHSIRDEAIEQGLGFAPQSLEPDAPRDAREEHAGAPPPAYVEIHLDDDLDPGDTATA